MILTAQGFPSDTHTRVVAELNPHQLTESISEATLTVRWFAGETSEAPPEFSFHYADETGQDFGWHHEPNPHVEEWGHYQEREMAGSEYSYESRTFSSMNPSRVVWEVLALLDSKT
ncbi:hypothetical protein C447_00510 [Halococcus hamelinensis 100A6]|uniref:Uncharacterized protein n=1 Tax=Halococcus hamelinensis 100A6 TaxID=1132509 RepID=M0M8I0_9EURY|nr:hypothetical protein C447_00510 [Halococcus hamelinensis 100A6]